MDNHDDDHVPFPWDQNTNKLPRVPLHIGWTGVPRGIRTHYDLPPHLVSPERDEPTLQARMQLIGSILARFEDEGLTTPAEEETAFVDGDATGDDTQAVPERPREFEFVPYNYDEDNESDYDSDDDDDDDDASSYAEGTVNDVGSWCGTEDPNEQELLHDHVMMFRAPVERDGRRTGETVTMPLYTWRIHEEGLGAMPGLDRQWRLAEGLPPRPPVTYGPDTPYGYPTFFDVVHGRRVDPDGMDTDADQNQEELGPMASIDFLPPMTPEWFALREPAGVDSPAKPRHVYEPPPPPRPSNSPPAMVPHEHEALPGGREIANIDEIDFISPLVDARLVSNGTPLLVPMDTFGYFEASTMLE
ncbi:hypothetical protein BC834DRAFT_969871 [Gloeopeniophorella convolvens]|nr:hypothetical protein BC834DRAFT_969871 [Gloeopeniophorella convolvens]